VSRRLPLLIALLAIAAPASAQAFTSSTLTLPAAGARFVAPVVGPAPAVTVKGTGSPAVNGEGVTTDCFFRSNLAAFLGPTGTTNAGGAFNFTVAMPSLGGACLLRAIYSGYFGTDYSPFAGRWVVFEHQNNLVNGSGRLFEFNDYVQQGSGGAGVRSVGLAGALGGGISSNRLTDTPGQRNSGDVFFYAGAFLSGDLSVDGHPAYSPTQANVINGAATSFPVLSVTRGRDGDAGDATIDEQDPLVTCAGDPPNPSATTCPNFASAGVRWDRRTHTSANGTRFEQDDTLVSTDGAAHTLAAWIGYSALTSDAPSPTPAWGVSWADGGGRSVRADDDQIAGPAGSPPGTLLLDRNSAASDGDFNWPHAAITWDSAPVAVHFDAHKAAAARFENIAVPAGGSTTLRTHYVIGANAADVGAAGAADRADAAHRRDLAHAPTLTLSAPADATTLFTPSVTVRGTAADAEGLASLVVAGRPVSPAPDGTFSLTLPLALGANRIDAVASDAAGQTATAGVTVTYKDTIAPALTGLTLSRSTFRVAKASTAIAAKAKKKQPTPQGTTIRYTLGEPAPVTLAITRVEQGRRSKGKCVKATKKLRKATTCDRLTAAGTLSRSAVAGLNAVAFSGRVGTKALKAGAYRLTATARDSSGNASRALAASFTVVSK
jgi:hypothetical protein